MKLSSLLPFLIGIVVSWIAVPAASGQKARQLQPPPHFKVLYPVHPPNKTKTKVAIASGQSQTGSNTLPLWDYSIVAGQDGNTYQGTMVGRSPFYNGHRSTTIQAYLVPVILTFPDGSVYDPTAIDACLGDSVVDLVQNSPAFQSTDFTFTDSSGNNPVDVGITQYGDAFQRANFWQYVVPNPRASTPYHTLLNLKTLPAVNVGVPPGYGFGQANTTCSTGEMDYSWWDSYVTFNLIPSLSGQGVGPNSVPIFIFDSVIMYLNSDVTQCCAFGDHGSFLNPSNLLQTYVVANFADSVGYPPDISVLSHEIGEWMDDPDNSNPTPAWGNVGPVQGCDNTLEVGDALGGSQPYVFQVTMPNGFTYNPQELVFFSWFYDQSPSIGAGGWYSDQGTFTSDAGAVCQ